MKLVMIYQIIHVTLNDQKTYRKPLLIRKKIVSFFFKKNLRKVTLQEDADELIHLRNLGCKPVTNEEDALNLLFVGDTNRMIAETPSNPSSSRSHCIFIINLTSRQNGGDVIRRSKLHLVDLAG